MNRTLLGALFAATSLSACGLVTGPKANPVIKNTTNTDANFTQTLGTTAERRLVLIKNIGTDEKTRLREEQRRDLANSNDKDDNVAFISDGFCAEPSPDSLEALASNFNANVSQTKPASSQSLQLQQALTTSAALATKRSQGLQFYRDTVFGLCQARLNGFISNKDFVDQLAHTRKVAAELMIAEMKTASFAKPVEVRIAPPASANTTKPSK